MAELKLSTVWTINEYHVLIVDECERSLSEYDELTQLSHAALPDVRWDAEFHLSSVYDAECETGFAGFFLTARFGSSVTDAKYVWAKYTATLLDAGGRQIATFESGAEEYAAEGTSDQRGSSTAFKMEDVNKAFGKDASLRIRVDLTILKIGEILKCRDRFLGLLRNQTMADFEVSVAGETFKLHKCVLAEASTVFLAMFESGTEEATDGILTLPDTNPAAFRAFVEAVYFDNWNFLADINATQAVLYLAEKYKVSDLKDYCDESLAEKVDQFNALEILTQSAALCNADKTTVACIDFLAEHTEFRETKTWLDFKKRNRGVALEILGVLSDKFMSANDSLKRENFDLKRKYEEAMSSSSKRRK